MLACDMFVTCDTYLVVKSGRTRIIEFNNLWGIIIQKDELDLQSWNNADFSTIMALGTDHTATLIDTAFIGHIGD
jgi:hypothetical protein